MPSPFPGMDPYLERADRWSGVHAALISAIREALARQVAPRFFVDSEDHVYFLGQDDPARSFIRPDLYMVETVSTGVQSGPQSRIATPALLDLPPELEVRVPYLTILDTVDREVVTTIELLSPFNKLPGSSGQRDFLRKRKQVMDSHTHWLEIDLQRGGARPPKVPADGDYVAVLHRAGAAKLAAWFMGLRHELPTIAVPLRPPFEDVPLSLQEAVETVYDRYRYDAVIDYGDDPPPPPLRQADAAWARERIAVWQQPRHGP